MTWKKRPLSVIIISCVYIVTGAMGFAYHFTEFMAPNPFQYDIVGIALVRLTAVVCGVFMLLGHNWARWVAVAWIAFHVIVGALHSLPQFAIHCLFFAVIAWYLFRPEVARFFRGARIEPT
jgi:hypothetical protein